MSREGVQNQLEPAAVLSWLVPKFATWLEVAPTELDVTQPMFSVPQRARLQFQISAERLPHREGEAVAEREGEFNDHRSVERSRLQRPAPLPAGFQTDGRLHDQRI
jgi:hypothetical protein